MLKLWKVRKVIRILDLNFNIDLYTSMKNQLGSKFQNSNFWLFLCLIIAVALLYNYPTHFSDSPKGNHTWRQTDCASLALNYYQDGLNPLKPRVHHVLAGGSGDGGGYGVGEFPILYYVTALLYKVFGVHEGIFRLLNFSIFCGGLLSLFLLLKEYTKNIYIALALPLMIWSSPVLGFYSFNFLSDAPALGFSLMGLYNFFRFHERGRQRYLNISMFCFLFAGLLKITALIPFVAISGLFALEFLGILKLKKEELLFPNKWKALFVFAIVVVGISAWYYTAIQYNEIHNTKYFSTRTWSYWSLDAKTQDYVWKRTFNFWLPTYAHPILHVLFAGSILAVLVRPKSYSKLEYGLVLLSCIGTVMFFFLWALAFIDHEYYIINLTYAPILAMIFLFKMLTREYPNIAKHWSVGLGLMLFTAFLLYGTRQKVKAAYDPGKYTIPAAYYDDEFDDFLKKHDIKFPELAYSTPDGSPNSTLYHLNLKGWSDLYGFKVDSSNVELISSWGTKYLIINDSTYLNNPEIQPLLKYPIDDFKGELFFYDLEPFSKKD